MAKQQYGDVEIAITTFDKERSGKAEVAVFRGGFGTDNPTPILNEAISKYVGTRGHNEFVEVHLDNPWFRVVLMGINNLDYKPYVGQTVVHG